MPEDLNRVAKDDVAVPHGRLGVDHDDPSGMARAIAAMPTQLRTGRRIGVEAGGQLAGPSGIVIAGMGGSAMGGELLRAMVANDCDVPITRVRGYSIPTWAKSGTLVVCVSYSGETVETLECARQAVRQGASVLVVTSGGQLSDFAEDRGLACARVLGGMMPRAALGYLFGAMAGAFAACGLADPAIVEDCAVGAELCDIPAAEQLGRSLAHTIPLISGAGPLAAVAYRWKTQFNENAKIHAFSHAFPELAHNEIVGWEGSAGLPFAMVALRDTSDGEQVSAMITATRDIVRRSTKMVSIVEGQGTSRNMRAFNLVAVGDWVSYYAALERRVDPTPIDSIMVLKSR